MLEIIRADKVKFDVREQMAEIFADGFAHWLTYFSKDKDIIKKAFAHMFVLNKFYVAITNNEVAGMVACTDCFSLSVKLDKKVLKKHFGLLKGSIAGIILKKEFESPFKNPQDKTGSIEFVGTAKEFRGKGVATEIIKYIIKDTSYNCYLIEEVADTNVPAMNLYKKLGFKEYKNKIVPKNRAQKIGINKFVSFKYINKL